MTIDNANFFNIGANPRDPSQLLWLPIEERQKHMAIVGASGAGKSQLLLDLIVSDITAGRGCAVIDPKGDLVEDVIAALSLVDAEYWPSLARDLVIIDPADPACTARFNPLEVTEDSSPSRQRQDLVSTWRRVFAVDDTKAARMMLVIRRAFALAMEHGLTLLDVPVILTDEQVRARLLASSSDVETRRFFESEFPASRSLQQQWTASTLTRLEVLLDDPAVRRFLSSPTSTFDFRQIFDEGRVCLITTSKGRLGQETSGLLSGLLLSRLQLAAESRATLPSGRRRPYYIYIDEFANFATESFVDLLAEARGYGVSLVLAHQHLAQLPDSLRHAILTNARIRVVFRCSYEDASLLSRELWRVSGERVKSQRWAFTSIGKLPIPYKEYDFYSTGDETRQNRELLHYLEDRMMAVHVAGEGAPYLVRTVDMPVAEIGRARERASELKRLVYRQHQPVERSVIRSIQEPLAAPAASRFEWAGAPRTSAEAEG